jgi:phosphatidylserine/phosphatidylglycerophosphate/cardiolipin synthase-like enzyme
VIADAEQTPLIENSVIPELAAAGIPVFLDEEHGAAHNKVMVIDEGQPSAAVITGSFNFAFAAQFRNAENLLLLRRGIAHRPCPCRQLAPASGPFTTVSSALSDPIRARDQLRVANPVLACC